ncbi:hypothetical protein [Arthrobacter sp. H35-D1]|uniref:hypothetical protein n=1 Tax=Arthrobacter sp. H35-D1 TaxID=3046202 RepID=UPI0024B977CD|nr:hypothetical protein [Arthrobacter sp. H35-D1]MDJ0315022.1 hypothetical protein [Arthrobacter sp. H35-D1]
MSLEDLKFSDFCSTLNHLAGVARRQDLSPHEQPRDRVAVLDNDGTLWCEKPLAQGVFIAQRLAGMAREDPSLQQAQPWKARSVTSTLKTSRGRPQTSWQQRSTQAIGARTPSSGSFP